MNESTPPGALVSAARVAEICGLSVHEIYQAHTPDMGSPKHFVYPLRATRQSYTLAGLWALCEGLDASGHAEAAHRLREVASGMQGAAPAVPAPAEPLHVECPGNLKPTPPARRHWLDEVEAREEAA